MGTYLYTYYFRNEFDAVKNIALQKYTIYNTRVLSEYRLSDGEFRVCNVSSTRLPISLRRLRVLVVN